MGRSGIVGLVIILLMVGCEEKEKKANVGGKLRSTGANKLSLAQVPSLWQGRQAELQSFNAMQANSTFVLEAYKIPVSRINLVQGLTGSGYSSASPNIYGCPHSTDAECLVDLTSAITVDDLLAGNPGTEEWKIDEEQTYEGVAVEFCHETSSFSAVIKGSVQLGATTYYTNATTGLSATAPSEEVSVEVQGTGCGFTTPLDAELTIGEDDSVSVILYADPNGAVMGTDGKTYANAGCVGEEDLAVCSGAVAVFGTVSDTTPVIERYILAVEDSSDVLLTIAFDGSDRPFGAYMRDLYTNTSEAKTMHSAANFSSVTSNADGTLTFPYSGISVIENFTRGSHSGSILSLVDSTVAYTATKL